MVSASRAGIDAPMKAARAIQSMMGESGRVNRRWTSCARRRDSAVSPESPGETGEGLQRPGRVDAHCCRLQAGTGWWRVAGGG